MKQPEYHSLMSIPWVQKIAISVYIGTCQSLYCSFVCTSYGGIREVVVYVLELTISVTFLIYSRLVCSYQFLMNISVLTQPGSSIQYDCFFPEKQRTIPCVLTNLETTTPTYVKLKKNKWVAMNFFNTMSVFDRDVLLCQGCFNRMLKTQFL